MHNGKSPTIHDVAREASVSPSTVSRVLNDNPHVNETIRSRVEEAIQTLGYERSRQTGVKKAGPSGIIGLIIPDLLNPFFPLLIKGIENVARIQGYSVILCDSENDIAIEEKHVKNLLAEGIEGLIFIAAPGRNSLVGQLLQEEFPLVFLDRTIGNEKSNCVTSANEEGAHQAVKYLLSLGHREIVYIAGPKYLSTENERYRGFKTALEEEGVSLREKLIVQGGHDWNAAYEKIRGLLDSGTHFTAVFASSDIMAFGAKQALEDRNLSVPDDVSIMGYDDIPFSSAISLTTVSQPAYEMGRNAMHLLIDLMKKRVHSPHRIVLRPSMIIRKSCKKV
jgi:LacI family transcriptional regulator